MVIKSLISLLLTAGLVLPMTSFAQDQVSKVPKISRSSADTVPPNPKDNSTVYDNDDEEDSAPGDDIGPIPAGSMDQEPDNSAE